MDAQRYDDFAVVVVVVPHITGSARHCSLWGVQHLCLAAGCSRHGGRVEPELTRGHAEFGRLGRHRGAALVGCGAPL